ncbi:MAG: MBL fold metallo-hydrolase [Clostridiales bacterium]|nr:MBL fold metallo-hydrolase [Clostridiales bacterium]
MGSKNRFYVDIMAMHEEVTGSCNLVVIKFPNGNTIRFVVDCGLFQERKYSELNEIFHFNPENIDFCLVTHNHVDHIGRLPLMVKNGFSNKIYATNTTCKLLPLALQDNFNILHDISKRKHTKCLYQESNIDETVRLLEPCNYNETVQINENIRVTFFMNGHLVGASLILVQISYSGYEDINLLFTGDYNNKNIFFDVPNLPDWVLELPLTLVQESTYGNMETKDMKQVFKGNIKNCLSNKGTVVALVFSLGRSQEILYELRKMQLSGDLDPNIPIYFDGKLAIRYTNLYIKDGLDIKNNMRDFLPENLSFVNTETRQEVLESKTSKIILTTSGMGSYGPAQIYIPEYISRKNSLIHFTGYTAEGTLGNKLKNAEHDEIVQIGGLMTKKNGKVEYTTEYSSHAKADEIISFLKQFKNIRLLLLNHGEIETKVCFSKRILREIETKNVGLLGREYFYRVNPYGLVKIISTKFD